MNRKEKTVLFFLLLFLFVIRLYHLNTAPLEITDSWRQADTESMARNFAQVDPNLFHPNLNYDGPFPNIPALEIQITTYLIAILYRVFGQHYFLARLVPVAFFLMSAIFLYGLARRHMGRRGAACAVLIYGILPVNVYYSRAIMPESAALMFWIGGIFYFDLGLLHSGKKYLALSAVLLALAIMTKPPVIFAAIPMIYLCYQSFGWKGLKMGRLWLYALFTLGLSAGYYYYSAGLSDYKFTVGITRNVIFKQALTGFYSPEGTAFFTAKLPETLGFTGLVLTAASLYYLSRKQRVFLVWLFAMILEVIFIAGAVRLDYYLIFLTVPCALLIGNFVARLSIGTGAKNGVSDGTRLRESTAIETGCVFGKTLGARESASTDIGAVILGAILLIMMMTESYHVLKPMYTINNAMAEEVAVVRQLTKPNDLLVISTIDPCLLSLADRRGWRYNIRIYPDIPRDPLEELNNYIESGAKYFVPVLGKIYGDENNRLLNVIEEKYTRIESTPGYPIYQLQ